jgi:RNA polymerase sigma-70 factor (ECF subfamily)
MDRVSPGYEDASDVALVVAVARFEEAALAEAYRRHAGAVFALARKLLFEKSTAEEIVQEVFLRLWDDPTRFDPGRGNLRSFLLLETHGRSVDLLRSDTSRRLREERDALRSSNRGYDVEHEVADLVTSDQVRRAVAELPDGEREAIQVAYFGGYTYREVAARLGVAEGTVKSRIRNGLRRLHSTLASAGLEMGGSDG